MIGTRSTRGQVFAVICCFVMLGICLAGSGAVAAQQDGGSDPIQVETTDIPSTVEPGSTFTISYVIENQGDAVAAYTVENAADAPNVTLTDFSGDIQSKAVDNDPPSASTDAIDVNTSGTVTAEYQLENNTTGSRTVETTVREPLTGNSLNVSQEVTIQSPPPEDPTARVLQIANKSTTSALTQDDVTATITRFERGLSVNNINIGQDDVTAMITLFERGDSTDGSDSGNGDDSGNQTNSALSFEEASDGQQPETPWSIEKSAGESQVTSDRSSVGSQSLYLAGGSGLGETWAIVDVDLTNVATIRSDIFTESSDTFFGHVKIHIDNKDGTIMGATGKSEGEWHTDLEGNVTQYDGTHKLILEAWGDDNRAYFDNIRFYDSSGALIAPSEIVRSDDSES